jgi:hypothetical protein
MPNNWWVPSQPQNNAPGQATYGGGGFTNSAHTAGAVQYRTPLDAERAAAGQLPMAEYPDGYLGTITDRHQDKLLDAVQNKLTERSYQRGVHKGAKIARQDYFWPDGFEPDKRLKQQAHARRTGSTVSVTRYAPAGNPVERLAHLGKTAGLTPPEQISLYKQYGVSIAKNPVVLTDPTRQARLQKMLPRYAM